MIDIKNATIKQLREMTGYLVECENIYSWFYQYPISESQYLETEDEITPFQDIYFIDICLN